MNRVILMGRLTRDPEVRYSNGERQMAIARYTLAVDRRGRSRSADGTEQTADFISCVAFDRSAEFAEKYFHHESILLFDIKRTGCILPHIQFNFHLRLRKDQRPSDLIETIVLLIHKDSFLYPKYIHNQYIAKCNFVPPLYMFSA